MKKFAVIAALAAFAVTGQSAQAGDRHKLKIVAIGVGAVSTATYLSLNNWRWHHWSNGSGITSAGAVALTTIGCMAVSPMIGTAVLKRPLTQREAGVLLGSCVVPVIGGWLVDAAYNAHPDWDPASASAHRGKKTAKM